MYVARLVCSDAECAEEHDFEVATLAELDLLACECGCALEVIAFPDYSDEGIAEAIVLRLRREPGGDTLLHAA